MAGRGCARKAILKDNWSLSFLAFGESVMDDVVRIAASVFGQSSRLSFMSLSHTLISVMLTKRMRSKPGNPPGHGNVDGGHEG